MTARAPLNVLICGTGASAHVLAAKLAALPAYNPTVFSLSARGDALRTALSTGTLHCDDAFSGPSDATAATLPVAAAADLPAAAAAADLVAVAVPSFAHEPYLRAVLPHVRADATLLVMPAYGAADLLARALWPRDAPLHLALADQLPWVCRTAEFGRRVRVAAHKCTVSLGIARLAAGRLSAGDSAAARVMEALLRDVCTGDVAVSTAPGAGVRATLCNPNAMMHAALLYGFYGLPGGGGVGAAVDKGFAQPPPFYAGVSNAAASHLDAVSAEAAAVRAVLTAATPGLADALAGAPSFHEWIRDAYANTIADARTTASCLRTNSATAALPHPMTAGDDDQFRPDFSHRYLSEDVPFGLIPLKGVADLTGVATPALDAVVCWAQLQLDACWVERGRLTAAASEPPARTPQRFGVRSVRDLASAYDEV